MLDPLLVITKKTSRFRVFMGVGDCALHMFAQYGLIFLLLFYLLRISLFGDRDDTHKTYA